MPQMSIESEREREVAVGQSCRRREAAAVSQPVGATTRFGAYSSLVSILRTKRIPSPLSS